MASMHEWFLNLSLYQLWLRLLIWLGSRFYCCCECNILCAIISYVATWAYAKNSGRNLDLNTIWFSCLHYILQYNLWIGFVSEKLNHFTGIWKRLKVTVRGQLPWSPYANAVLNHDKVSIFTVTCFDAVRLFVLVTILWTLVGFCF